MSGLTKERIAELREWLGVAESYLPHFESAKRGREYIDDIHRTAIDDLLSILTDYEAMIAAPTDEEREELLAILEILDTQAEDGLYDELGGIHSEVDASRRETKRLTDKVRALVAAPQTKKPKVTMEEVENWFIEYSRGLRTMAEFMAYKLRSLGVEVIDEKPEAKEE